MKVVWLCHFANQEVKDYFNTPDVKESAPWINNLIELFRIQPGVDLHIVAPNNFTNTTTIISKAGVTYHFYAIRSKWLPAKVNSVKNKLFDADYSAIQARISRIIEEIKPDIIHLHGAENPYYSSGILPLIGKYPILLTIQGFARNSVIKTRQIKQCMKFEEEIIKKIENIGVRTTEMREIALSLNPGATLHFHNYPVTIPKVVKQNKSKYDIIFFARVCKDKGIEDLLKAVALLKKDKKDISLHIIGSISKFYKPHLNRLIKSLSLEPNVVMVGFMQNQPDIFKYAIDAEISVLPTYHDIIPGTIIESMFMKLPVVAYAIGGIPELNSKVETILLVEKQNIPQLAEKIMQLLNNEVLRKTLSEVAYSYVNELVDNTKVVSDIKKAYNSILNKVVE